MSRATEQTPWIVFYSWQSDLPNASNRGFIETALENACKALQASLPHRIGPIIDRDTKGVPGSPEIARTIFGKIDQAQVVVCDVSLINSACLKHEPPARASPNPNVLIELGYALQALEDKCVILVMNVAYGGIEFLPFDLKTRRTITYNVPADAPDRQQERKRLEGIFADALRAVGEDLSGRMASVTTSPPLIEQAVTAIDETQPRRISLVRQYMKQFTAEIAALMPPPQDIQRSRSDDVLSEAIDATISAVGQYSRLVAFKSSNPSPLPGASFRDNSFPQADIDGSGNLYVVWTNYTSGHGVVKLAKSTNQGASWTVSTAANVASRSPFYPAVATSGANVFIGFNALDDVSAGTAPGAGVVHYDAYYVLSQNGGASFGGAVKISATSSDPDAASTNGLTSQFLGDYNGAAAGSNGTFWFSWTDTRNGATCAAIDAWRASGFTTTQPNIYDSCPNGFGNSDIFVATVAPPFP